MSEQKDSSSASGQGGADGPARPAVPVPAAQQRGPAAWMNGPSMERPKDFRGSLRRVLGLMRPERPLILFTSLCAAGSVGSSLWGPKILGNATNIIFSGFKIGRAHV